DMLRVDLPHAGGGVFTNGVVSLTIGKTGSVAENGVYSFPATLRAFESVLQTKEDVAMGNGGTVTFVVPEWIYTCPDAFYQTWKEGAAQTDADYGKPTSFLIYGRQIHLRPIPKQTAVAAPWWRTLLLAGSLYSDTSGLSEPSECPVPAYEPFLVAQGTAMEM